MFKVFRAFIVLTGLAFLVASCETTNTSQQGSYLDTFALSEIVVNFEEASEPMHVAEIETNYRKSKLASGELSRPGQRFSLAYQDGKRQALYDSIAQTLKPHLRDQLGPKFRGTRPAKAVIYVKNVFIRSRGNLAALTGAEVTLNGVRSPDNAQVVASIELMEAGTNIPLQNLSPISAIEGGAELFNRNPPPVYGESKRLSKLSYDWAFLVAQKISQTASIANLIDRGQVPGLLGQ